MNKTLYIHNIGRLVVVPRGPIGGRSMGHVPRIDAAAILIRDGDISWFGRESDADVPAGASRLDACGGCVVPGLIDAHTHAVFAGSREMEFVQRIEGRSYAEIAEAGGGIRVTMQAVRAASVDDLVQYTVPRLQRMLRNGVTTVEIKSGYGLSVEHEMKMLTAIRRLQSLQPVELVPTYLAAHTVPPEFEGSSDAYLNSVFDTTVLARLRDERLAEFCDVFCERTAFKTEQCRRVLSSAVQFGLWPKVHADQITQMGASRLAAELRAISSDHLEKIDDASITALKSAGTIAVLLPACSFFLGVEQAPARKLLEADLPVAVATDYNPGSSMVESLPLTLSIACTQLRMTPAETLIAATANAAAALSRQTRLGCIRVGAQADLVLLDVPNLERWMYEPGRNCVRAVIKSGQLVAGNQHCASARPSADR